MLSIFRSYSTLHAAMTRRQTASDLQNEMSVAQQELSTGFKADVYKSLGVGAAQTLNLRAAVDRDEAQIATNGLLANRMDTMSQVLGSIRDTLADTVQLGVSNKTAPMGTVTGLQASAKAALDSIIAQGNSGHSGTPLFSGTDNPGQTLQTWRQANPGSGRAPSEVLDNIIGGGVTDQADALAKIAQLDAVFSDSAADPTTNFQQTFYNGSVDTDPRLSATIGEGTVLHYGVQANDAAFRDVIQGLAMLATTDPAQIDDAGAYSAWVGKAVDLITQGSTSLLNAETNLGAQSAQIETSNTRIMARMDIYTSRILDLEGVDSYEAATRISLLETQLQATYAVTARMSQLSFLNYM